ncbi:3'-5' exonuclease [Bradyrhizobium sp. 188]|uniref:3'-5' exonuclease n=1 Tax=Bradyrhizobium sp. 188 TaxID=2782656 RepID=UPI001FF8CAB3|nr:3'-5' exonuclease [Bradyrhizobium sp. 188]MCK1500456.1 3'-5' exonuclease [Bradyrhizobium sp. 188]
MTDTKGLETFARHLEESGDYRVLRRLIPRPPQPTLASHRIGIILDLETTGLDTARDEVIEIAMVKFGYARDDRVTHVIDTFQAFQQPTAPITPAIAELTGITDAMVAEHRIDPDELAAFGDGASANVIIAHNASFDRKVAERFWPFFTDMNWACSATGVDWKSIGFSGAKLDCLLAGCGLFHGAHRALDDCNAVLEVLAREVPDAGKSGLAFLLERARRTTHRVWAESSPFELRHELKARGYRWSDGSDGRPRAWYADVDDGDLESELAFLRTEIYQCDTEIAHHAITARDRYSNRV